MYIIPHVHKAVDYLDPSGFSGYVTFDTKIVLKNYLKFFILVVDVFLHSSGPWKKFQPLLKSEMISS